MTITSEMWQKPRELPGVKSRKRPIFEISFGSLDVADADAGAGGVHRVSGPAPRKSAHFETCPRAASRRRVFDSSVRSCCRGLKLTLESRVATLGPGGQIALQLLLGQLVLKSGKAHHACS